MLIMEKHQDVLIALRRIMRATDIHSHQLLRRTGLSAAQFHVLRAINETGTDSTGVIARRAGISQATLTTLLDRLESRSLVSRERHADDKRKVMVRLTEAGVQALAEAPALLQEHFIARFQALPEWEQHLILAGLHRVAEMMDAQDLDVAPLLEVAELS